MNLKHSERLSALVSPDHVGARNLRFFLPSVRDLFF